MWGQVTRNLCAIGIEQPSPTAPTYFRVVSTERSAGKVPVNAFEDKSSDLVSAEFHKHF